jgi:septal ring factor EnvC (AmiA/AmiB activator)
MTKTKTARPVETPVELLADRRRELERQIEQTDRELRATERRRERLTSGRAAQLEELRGVTDAIRRLGGEQDA